MTKQNTTLIRAVLPEEASKRTREQVTTSLLSAMSEVDRGAKIPEAEQVEQVEGIRAMGDPLTWTVVAFELSKVAIPALASIIVAWWTSRQEAESILIETPNGKLSVPLEKGMSQQEVDATIRRYLQLLNEQQENS